MAKRIITSYCVTRDHWILAAVVAKRNKVFYLDSLRIAWKIARKHTSSSWS